MTLPIALALMMGFSVFAVLYPLSLRVPGVQGSERDVYLAQLGELEREQEQGLLNPNDATSARLEISRRVLSARDTQPVESPSYTVFSRKLFTVLAIIFIPALSLGLYILIGSPERHDEPLAARIAAPADNLSMGSLVARVEKILEENPDAGSAADVLAPLYLQSGKFQKAVKAFATAIRVLGSTPQREAGLGEALVLDAKGQVTPAAKSAFEHALAMDKTMPIPRYYIGLSARQAGDVAAASAIWQDIVRTAPPDIPWIEKIRLALVDMALNGISAVPPFSREEGQKIMSASRQEQEVFVRAMVQRLEDQVNADETNIELRLRLIKARFSLGEKSQALKAVEEGLPLFNKNPDATRRLNDLFLGLGLDKEQNQ
jgi:cytochrome c-type biogenesis protein CcmH